MNGAPGNEGLGHGERWRRRAEVEPQIGADHLVADQGQRPAIRDRLEDLDQHHVETGELQQMHLEQ